MTTQMCLTLSLDVTVSRLVTWMMRDVGKRATGFLTLGAKSTVENPTARFHSGI